MFQFSFGSRFYFRLFGSVYSFFVMNRYKKLRKLALSEFLYGRLMKEIIEQRVRRDLITRSISSCQIERFYVMIEEPVVVAGL